MEKQKEKRVSLNRIREAFESFPKTEKIRTIFNIIAVIVMLIASYGMYQASLDGTDVTGKIIGAVIYFIIVSATIIETNYLGVDNKIFKILFIGTAMLKMILAIVNGASLKNSFDSNSIDVIIAILIIIKTTWLSIRKKREVLFHRTDTFVKIMMAVIILSCLMIETTQGFTEYDYSINSNANKHCSIVCKRHILYK